MAITIKEIAEYARVSKATVSRILNNHPDVSDQTRQRVLSIIDKLNYQPNIYARNILRKKSGTIGLLMSEDVIGASTNPFYLPIINSIQKELSVLNYHLLISTVNPNYKFDFPLPRMIQGGRTEGILIMGHINAPFLQRLKVEKIPFEVIEDYSEKEIVDCVVSDDYGGAYKAVKYLVELGHKRIGFIRGPLKYPSILNRYNAYRNVLEFYKLEYDQNLVFEERLDYKGGYRAMREILASKTKSMPTAVFCANDWMALGAMEAIKEKGLKIPEDISIVGFDDIELASQAIPSLTTVRISKEDIGIMAVRKLMEIIKDPDKKLTRTVIPTELIERKSCRVLDNMENL